MSETIKLIIEIPKEVFEARKVGEISPWVTTPILDSVQNGKPLSEELAEIREEIKALDEGITSYEHDDPWIYKREALEVIDKHISGEGDKE